ncbi:hypothetical protein N0R80_13795 [Sinorhizobium sp. C101]|nr:hypothetical protein [Sinorhizobium sp. C101]WEJ36162.1 hypothetical protein N0R80_13795 [Sinorhizobium sp. C101]
MAEQHDRQAGMAGHRHIAERAEIRDDLGSAIPLREHGGTRIGGTARAVAAVVMGVDVETLAGHGFGKAGIAAGMLGKAVADDENALRFTRGAEMAPAERRAGRASMRPHLTEHAMRSPPLADAVRISNRFGWERQPQLVARCA